MTDTATDSAVRDAIPKVSVLTLAAMVVGSMVGGGVFTLPQNFGAATGVLGALIAWTIAGLGMLMLAFVFQSLAVRRPDLDSGIYIYAQAGFGNYCGFNAAWGYWASNVVGNVFFMVFAMASIGEFVPGLGQGNTVLAVLLASALVWTFHVLIARGIRQAAIVNRIVTVAKLVPILVFVVIAAVAFDAGIFADNFWGDDQHTFGSVFDQVTDTMLVTTFVFIGIEGASVYSRLARRREDVGRATLLGFTSTLALFASVTLVSYGVLPQHDLATAKQPSIGVVLESVVGDWGATFISVGVIISVLGAYLAWTLLNAEVMYMPARTDVMPRLLARENRHRTPIAALVTTNLSVQALPAPGAGRRRRARVHAEARHRPDPGALPARRGVRREAGGHPRDLHRRRGAGRRKQLAGRRDRGRLLPLPALRRRPRVPPARLPHLRTRHRAVRRRPPRARRQDLPAGRGGRVRGAVRR